MKKITKAVWILSLISLFTDISSEMLYPIMPLYLKSIGFSVVLIGVLEGFAEAIAGLSKGYFGKLSDQNGKRVPFVQFGYLLSAISKPIMGFFTFPLWIFLSRTMDRLGKGIRTGARDALLSDEATPETKGKVFGFHRSMDTLGAVIGPTFALVFLYFYPENYTALFFISAVPGLSAFLVSGLLKEKNKTDQPVEREKTDILSYFIYWKNAPSSYKKLVIGLLIFGLVNSSDLFLLLMAKAKGLGDSQIIGIYIFYNLVYALFSLPAGIIADKIGLKPTLVFGLFTFALVYGGMAFAIDQIHFYFLFFLYGIYAASTEGISKALISNLTPKSDSASAIGTFAGLNSIAALIASNLGGLIWFYSGPKSMFMSASLVSIAVSFYFIRLSIKKSED
ncbi:MFS transporter [Leptospira sp. WS58.C1]|uniref:MFS transporter n=1 Tax=Leptospira TaxID=171 RepID=UPI0002BEFB54|nr:MULTISPECIES: MFS transporter [unclassified Leptospira]EMK00438.1 transporter, major facilitator family protein [Leptospira sp. B5-022]MCR1793741.1 MFS transporter [Leptospira sp. id769339]